MNNLQILEAVSERDVDLLLLEELAVNSHFLRWWLERTGMPEPVTDSGVIAQHSVSDSKLGESDLVIVYTSTKGESHALLIENKVIAIPQPDQALRYKHRGDAGIANSKWRSFRTCIVAPSKYLSGVPDAKLYDVQISYEDIRDWFAAMSSDNRAVFRSKIMSEAIDQSRRGYTHEADERMTEFWHRYWEYASVEFPEFALQEPGPKPSKSTWVEIRPEALAPGRRIYHKLQAGFVDLQIDGAAEQADAIRREIVSLLGSDTEVVMTGKSTSIRVRVPPLDTFGDFEDQLPAARAGMRAVYRLIYLARAVSAA
jgi:hypothetical protein